MIDLHINYNAVALVGEYVVVQMRWEQSPKALAVGRGVWVEVQFVVEFESMDVVLHPSPYN